MRLAISRAPRDVRIDKTRGTTAGIDQRRLYRLAGVAALISTLLIPVQIGVYIIWPPPFDGTTLDWFTLFQDSPLLGLLSLDLLLLVDWILLVPIYLALFVALRRTDMLLMVLGTALFATALASYLASNTAFEMLSLSDQYTAAMTDVERTALLAAGESMLATFEGTAFHVSYILGQTAGIIIGAVMLRSRRFGRALPVLMVAGNAVGFGLYLPVIGLALSAFSGVVLWGWYILLTYQFLRMNEGTQVEPTREG